ncbi:MAG TPA: CaiB/BaiF CoA-transferase family protein [Alphaproteobacteria bacterium]|nr:CaiB/BaiF CoA-transferase family protein [Alphaproteobacteria bacterium]
MALLSGIRVISFNHFLMGPMGIQYLADLGADVIAVEPIEGAFQRKWSGADKTVDGQSMLFLCGNRNKRSVALDLKSPAGREIARKLVDGADVMAENFRPGVIEKLGLGYDTVKTSNPRIVYASASGYGSDGPYVERPGQDLMIQALSGLAAITGSVVDGARAVGVSAVDHHGAALLALGILAALVGRVASGTGCRVDVNLLSAAIDLQAESFTTYFNGVRPGTVRQPRHLATWYHPAPYGIYPTKDGHIAISMGSLKALGEALDEAELAATSERDIFVRRDEIAARVAARVARQTTSTLERTLTEHGVWNAPVNDYVAVEADPQVRHNGTFVTLPGATGAPITLVAHPNRYDGKAPEVRIPPQPLGAQTAEVLTELGYSDAEIRGFARTGAIRG